MTASVTQNHSQRISVDWIAEAVKVLRVIRRESMTISKEKPLHEIDGQIKVAENVKDFQYTSQEKLTAQIELWKFLKWQIEGGVFDV